MTSRVYVRDACAYCGAKTAGQGRRHERHGGMRSRGCVYSAWVRRMFRKIWRGLREWCGDAAYERYLRSPMTRASTSGRLTAAEFYVEQLNRRYSRPNRCC
jgi:uncharacterized short protein YbdD (DUF466 family)